MKYIKILEKYAYSVDGFPFEDLEVDYALEYDKIVVSLYWTGTNGETNSKKVAWIPKEEFKFWPYTPSAKRFIRSKVADIGSLEPKKVLLLREENKTRTGRKAIPVDPYDIMLDGVTYHVQDHHAFCAKKRLNASLMKKVIAGTVRSHKGFHLPSTNADDIVVYNRDTPRVFINKRTGDVVMTTNVSSFCKEQGLNYQSFKKILQGRKVTSEWEYMGIEER